MIAAETSTFVWIALFVLGGTIAYIGLLVLERRDSGRKRGHIRRDTAGSASLPDPPTYDAAKQAARLQRRLAERRAASEQSKRSDPAPALASVEPRVPGDGKRPDQASDDGAATPSRPLTEACSIRQLHAGSLSQLVQFAASADVLVALEGTVLRYWRGPRYEESVVFSLGQRHQWSAIHLSPDGRILLAEQGMDYHVYDLTRGGSCLTSGASVMRAALGCTEEGIIVVSRDTDQQGDFYETRTIDGRPLGTLRKGNGSDRSFRVLPLGGRLFVTAHSEGATFEVSVVEQKGMRVLAVVRDDFSAYHPIVPSADGMCILHREQFLRLASGPVWGNGVNTRFWQPSTRLVTSEGHGLMGGDLSSTGDIAITYYVSGTVRFWETRRGREVGAVSVGTGFPAVIEDAKLSHDGATAAVITRDGKLLLVRLPA